MLCGGVTQQWDNVEWTCWSRCILSAVLCRSVGACTGDGYLGRQLSTVPPSLTPRLRSLSASLATAFLSNEREKTERAIDNNNAVETRVRTYVGRTSTVCQLLLTPVRAIHRRADHPVVTTAQPGSLAPFRRARRYSQVHYSAPQSEWRTRSVCWVAELPCRWFIVMARYSAAGCR